MKKEIKMKENFPFHLHWFSPRINCTNKIKDIQFKCDKSPRNEQFSSIFTPKSTTFSLSPYLKKLNMESIISTNSEESVNFSIESDQDNDNENSKISNLINSSFSELFFLYSVKSSNILSEFFSFHLILFHFNFFLLLYLSFLSSFSF
jgi:hypothetical protein